jgi:hypothetical protein
MPAGGAAGGQFLFPSPPGLISQGGIAMKPRRDPWLITRLFDLGGVFGPAFHYNFFGGSN